MVRKGRIWLIFILLLLRGIDCLLYFSDHAPNKNPIIAVVIISNLWSVVLLTAIWFRQSWARYTMVGLIFLWLALAFIFAEPIAALFGGYYVLIAVCAGYLVPAIILIRSHGIEKLTNRSFG